MSLSRKHYQAIATLLSDATVDVDGAFVFPVSGEEMRHDIIGRMADYFASDNPQFDRARFLAACGLDKVTV